jgi:hypothetical protein
MAVLANPASGEASWRVQVRLRGWRCRGLLFGDRPCEDSRVPLTQGRTGVQ